MGLSRIFDIVPDRVEHKSAVGKACDDVSKWLRAAARVGDSIPVLGEIPAAIVSGIAGVSDIVAHNADKLSNGDGLDLGGTLEITTASAAESVVFLVEYGIDFVQALSTGVKAVASQLPGETLKGMGNSIGDALEILDAPLLASYGASTAFNAVADRDESAVFQSRKDKDVIDVETTTVTEQQETQKSLPAPTQQGTPNQP